MTEAVAPNTPASERLALEAKLAKLNQPRRRRSNYTRRTWLLAHLANLDVREVISVDSK